MSFPSTPKIYRLFFFLAFKVILLPRMSHLAIILIESYKMVPLSHIRKKLLKCSGPLRPSIYNYPVFTPQTCLIPNIKKYKQALISNSTLPRENPEINPLICPNTTHKQNASPQINQGEGGRKEITLNIVLWGAQITP